MRNLILSFGGDVFVKFIGFVIVIAIARLLGDTALGQYSFVVTLTWIIFKIAELGLDMVIRKEMSRDKEKASQDFFSQALALRFFASFLAAIVTIAFVYGTHRNQTIIHLTYLTAIGMIFFNVSMIFRSAFYALQKMHYEVIVKVISNLAFLLGIVFMFLGFGLTVVIIFLLIRYVLSFVLSYLLFRKKISKVFKLKISLKNWNGLIKESYFFWIITALSMIYFRIDIIILSLMKNEAIVGWYTAGYRIIDMISLIPVTITSVLFPVMAELFVKDKEKLSKLYKIAFRYLLILALAMILGVGILSQQIIHLLYGKGFENAAIVLKVLIWAQGLMFISFLLINLLGAINKQRVVVITSATALALNVVLNFILIPKYSFLGAGWATLLAEIVNCIFLLFFVIKYFEKPEIKSTFSILLIFGSVYTLFLLSQMNPWINAMLGVLIFGTILMFLKIIKKEDVALFFNSIKLRKNM